MKLQMKLFYTGNKTAISLLLVMAWADNWFSLSQRKNCVHYYIMIFTSHKVTHASILAMEEYACNES